MRTLGWTILAISSISLAQAPQSHDVPKNTPEMARHFGHGTPQIGPLTDLDHKPFALKPLKGRWTLLYFWADWCVPCIQEGIPDLTSFVNAHPADEGRFQIIAIRFGSTHENFEWMDFHTKTLELEKSIWRNVPPFPIVYDETSDMTTAWGVHELPTSALIDPSGDLVRDGNLAVLRAKIEGK